MLFQFLYLLHKQAKLYIVPCLSRTCYAWFCLCLTLNQAEITARAHLSVCVLSILQPHANIIHSTQVRNFLSLFICLIQRHLSASPNNSRLLNYLSRVCNTYQLIILCTDVGIYIKKSNVEHEYLLIKTGGLDSREYGVSTSRRVTCTGRLIGLSDFFYLLIVSPSKWQAQKEMARRPGPTLR